MGKPDYLLSCILTYKVVRYMARSSNAAYKYDYNFKRFEEKKETIQPELKVVEQRAAVESRNFTLKVIGYVTVFFVGVIGIILNQSAITEVTMQISSKTTELENLQSEYRQMETELESMMALNNIEEVVTRDLGMSKLRDDQITYLKISEGDKVYTPEDDADSFLGKIKAGIDKILEYIKPEKNTMN